MNRTRTAAGVLATATVAVVAGAVVTLAPEAVAAGEVLAPCEPATLTQTLSSPAPGRLVVDITGGPTYGCLLAGVPSVQLVTDGEVQDPDVEIDTVAPLERVELNGGSDDRARVDISFVPLADPGSVPSRLRITLPGARSAVDLPWDVSFGGVGSPLGVAPVAQG